MLITTYFVTADLITSDVTLALIYFPAVNAEFNANGNDYPYCRNNCYYPSNNIAQSYLHKHSFTTLPLS